MAVTVVHRRMRGTTVFVHIQTP